MTTEEALVALMIGCKVCRVKQSVKGYYFKEGDNIMCSFPGLGLIARSGLVKEFKSLYTKIEWELYDDSRSNISDEDWMQNQS